MSDANTKTLTTALKAYPDAKIQTEKQFVKQQESGINFLLDLLYVLLSLSIVVSVAGIINTLVLTVFERTRELGMLRAVGMTPDQARGLIRNESMITAAIGTIVGIGLGLALAWIITRALTDQGIVFAVPWPQVGLVLVLGLLAGVLAAIAPAGRAARIDVLAAIAHE